MIMVAIYSTAVGLGLTERSRRSLSISKSSGPTSDFVVINTTVTSIDTTQGVLHERIRLIPKGRFALDKSTPSTDLKLLINSASGKQTVVFPKGDRIFPIEFTSLLTGDQNRYPFDNYMTYIDVLVTAPAKKVIEVAPEEPLPTDADPLSTTLIVGTSDLDHSETVSITENVTASIPGVRFEGDVAQNKRNQVVRATISIRRAYNVMTVSLIVMLVMFWLAISVLGMVLHVTYSPREMSLIRLSLCVSLIFGLPALRNVQPGVPPVGALSGYISFILAYLSYRPRQSPWLGYGSLGPRVTRKRSSRCRALLVISESVRESASEKLANTQDSDHLSADMNWRVHLMLNEDVMPDEPPNRRANKHITWKVLLAPGIAVDREQ